MRNIGEISVLVRSWLQEVPQHGCLSVLSVQGLFIQNLCSFFKILNFMVIQCLNIYPSFTVSGKQTKGFCQKTAGQESLLPVRLYSCTES